MLARLPLVALVLALAAAPAMAADSSYNGPKWEYRIENLLAGAAEGLPGAGVANVVANMVLSNPDSQRFKDLGQDGWELVAVVNGRAYFKRPVPQPKGWWPF